MGCHIRNLSHNQFLYPTCPATWWRWKEIHRSHSSVCLHLLPPGGGPWRCNVGVWQDWRTEVRIRFVIIFMLGTDNYVSQRSYFSRVLSFHLFCIYKFYYLLRHFPSYIFWTLRQYFPKYPMCAVLNNVAFCVSLISSFPSVFFRYFRIILEWFELPRFLQESLID